MTSIPEDKIILKTKNEKPAAPEDTVSMELIEFISSEKTSAQIADICLKNGVVNETKIEEVSYRIALVILGALPRESLTITLNNGVGLDAQTAENISAETDKLIFSQMPHAQPQLQLAAEVEVEKPEEKVLPKPPKLSAKDTYREKLE